ncbi:hypothetical protein SEUCBS139899_009523 [Sporothrix eucalyptigena]
MHMGDKIDNHFQDKSVDMHVVGIYGPIGVGKSYVALQFLYQSDGLFEYRFWVNAGTDNSLRKSMEDVAKHLGISKILLAGGNYSPDDIRVKLQVKKRWLLVFDNVQSIEAIRSYWPHRYSSDCCIVLTSRDKMKNRPSELISQTIDVDCFSETGAAFWLLRRLDNHHENDAAETGRALDVVRMFGCLPLALDYVVSYINGYYKTLQMFLDEVRADENPFVAHCVSVTSSLYGQSAQAAYKAQYECLSSQAKDVLNTIAFLDPDSIPLILIGQDPGLAEFIHMNNAYGKGPADEYYCPENPKPGLAEIRRVLPVLRQRSHVQKAVNELLSQSLVEKHTKYGQAAPGVGVVLRVNRLMQWLRRYEMRLTPDHQISVFCNAVNCIWQCYPPMNDSHSLAHNWTSCAQYTPHVLSAFHCYKNRQDSGLVAPWMLYALVTTCGYYFLETGQTGTALPLLEALTTFKQKIQNLPGLVFGLNHRHLATLYRIQRRPIDAETFSGHALDHTFYTRSKPAHRQCQAAAMAFRIGYLNSGAENALDQCIQLHTAANELVANCVSSAYTKLLIGSQMAAAYLRWGKTEEAYELIQGTVALHAKCDRDTPYLLDTIYIYGNVQWARGQQDHSYSLHQECLQRRITLLGRHHYATGVSYHKTGYAAYRLKHVQEAIDHLTKAEKVFRNNTDDWALWPRTCLLLGRILVETGKATNTNDNVASGEKYISHARVVIEGKRMNAPDINNDGEVNNMVLEEYR